MKFWKRFGGYMPILATIVVVGCVGTALKGYAAPVYEVEQPENIQSNEADAKEKKQETEETEQAKKGNFDLADGFYKGSGTGFAGTVSVSVEIKDKSIIAINILSTQDDEAFFNRAKGVIDKIIAGQTLDVDVVSGATYSSNGIISAVKNALTGEQDTSTPATTASSSSQSSPSIETVDDSNQTWKDGIYYGSGTGFNGEVQVEVVIADGKISNISVVSHNDDSSFMSQAQGLIPNIISSQSTNVDAVSGATYSSRGIIDAVRAALKQAVVNGSSNDADDSNDGNNNNDNNNSNNNSTIVEGKVPYEEGIYYGTGEGYAGDVQLAVVIQDKTIKAILVTECEDDAAFFNRAKSIINEVLKNQSTDFVFTSATLNKTRTASLAGGSYHTNADGSQIDGITFPVKVTDDMDMSKYTQVTDDDSVDITVTNRGQTSTTTYKGKDALFQNADYAYYNLTEVPSYYKEVSVDKDGNLTFGKTVGNVTTLEGLSAELSTETSYGDYQLDIDGLRDKLTEIGVTNINGVVINTKEGSSYGLRHLENIWRMEELAWATGFTEAVHGCPTSSDHYKAMMGQTITSVTYYTDKGMYNIPLADIYVPVKFTHDLEVANAAITAGKTEVTVTGLPDDYAAEYKVDGLDGVSVQNGVLTFNNAKKGKYTLTISDKKGKYADITTEFELYTEAMPAAYDADKKALVKTADATDEEFADYIKSISVVSVNGKDYRATGRGATVIINEDGSIKTDAAPFAEGDTFEITVSATGYLPQSFTYTTKEAPAPAEVNTEALKATIAKAEGLKEADYTADSWAAMQTSLTSAKAALEAKESQEAVDAASASLQSSIDALKAATPAETEEETKDDKKDETATVDTAALEKVIATAKGLKKNDYTAATWSTLQTALTNAEKALDAKESQKSVDEAAKTLQAAIDGLKKAADTTATTDDKKNNNNNNNSTNKNNTTNKNTTTSKNSPKTGDPVSVLGLLGAAISSVGIGGLGLRLRKKSKREDEE